MNDNYYYTIDYFREEVFLYLPFFIKKYKQFFLKENEKYYVDRTPAILKLFFDC